MNQSTQGVWGPQGGALAGLYGDASALADQQAGQVGGVASGLAATGGADTQAGIGALKTLASGGGPLSGYANPNSDLARQQLANATADIQQNMNRVTMPGINSAAGLAGGIGGARQGIAQGVAMGDAASAIGKAGTDIYSNMYSQGAQAAAGQTDAMLSAGSALPGAATSAYNLGMSPFSSQWGPYSQLASILGGPTVLGNSYGISQALSGQENWGTASSSGSQRSLGINLWS